MLSSGSSCPISSPRTRRLSIMKGNEPPCCGEQAAFKMVEQKSCKDIVRCCAQPSAWSCPVDMRTCLLYVCLH